MTKSHAVIGVGSPMTDLLAEVSEDFLARYAGTKGGMEHIDNEKLSDILSHLPGSPKFVAGGSAANTIFALAHFGVPTAFIGKLGNDEFAESYREQFQDLNGNCDHFRVNDDLPTARCLSLVTPDSERTMRTCLSAAATLSPDEITPDDFRGFYLAHIEGYILFNPDLARAVLQAAKTAGCLVSLDLGSFEVVNSARDILTDLLKNYVDIVFANEDEARAFTGGDDLHQALDQLSSLCDIAAVKLGAQGAMIKRGNEKVTVPAQPVTNVIDTTGAGDYWAAGFLFGFLNDRSLADSATLGAHLGAAVVQQLGADLPDYLWNDLHKHYFS